MKVFAMFDKKSGEYFGICLWKKPALYCRSIAPVVNDRNPQNLLHTCPEDFDLYCLGEFDQNTGEIVSAVEFICSAATLVSKEDAANG